MSDKEKVVKLNALLKKNNGKINYNNLKSLKIKDKKIKVSNIKGGNITGDNGGIIKPANPSEVAKSLNLKYPKTTLTSKIVHTGQGYSRGQILAKKDDSKVNKIYSTEPEAPIQFNRDTIKGYSPDEAENGLEAADKGLATTLNGGYVVMNNRLREPNFYDKLAVRNDLLPLGYKAAYMINSLKKRISPELQSTEELKVKRKQVMENFSVLLRQIGSTALKAAIGEIANDISLEVYDGYGIVDKVIANIPSNVESIPNDMDAMQALITGLNSTSKKALILDEIYVNAMLTMFLNDYNRKNMRPTYFLLRPFDEIKSFTDSEGMFSNQLNVTKIRSVTNDYNFAGTDFIYVDTSLMKDYTFHIICELVRRVKRRFNDESNYCQIVVKTSTNLGANENEFFKNMGKTIFTEIFETAVNAEGITVEQAYNIITGKQQNNEDIYNRLDRNNTSITDTSDAINNSLGDINTNSGLISNRIRDVNDNLTAMQQYKIKEAERQREAEITRIQRSIDTYGTNIAVLSNAAAQLRARSEIAEAKEREEEVKIYEVLRLAKLIELGKLRGEDTTEFEIELRRKEDSKTRAIIKAQQEEIAKLVKQEQERAKLERSSSPIRSDVSRIPESTMGSTSGTSSTQGTSVSSPAPRPLVDLLTTHKMILREELNKIKSLKEGSTVSGGYLQVINGIKQIEVMLNGDYNVDFNDMDVLLTNTNKPFDIDAFVRRSKRILDTFKQKLSKDIRDAFNLCNRVIKIIDDWYKDYTKEKLTIESETEPASGRTRSKIQGQGISSYRHVRGGSISTFVERMHNEINIKSIVKFNKSAYVINI